LLITKDGYALKFIQTHPVLDNSSHKKSYIFKFFASRIKLHYIVRVEYHDYDFFALKFYAKKDRKSEHKYSNLVNKGDVSNILITCAKVIPALLKEHPKASFGFIGSRSIDRKNKVEGYANNQRFRLYSYHIPQLIGSQTFIHKSYEEASSYTLINRAITDISKYEEDVKNMIVNTYEGVLNVD